MGLKSGSGDGGLGDTEADTEPPADADRQQERDLTPEPTPDPDTAGYLWTRDGTRDGRTLIQFFARPDVYSQNDEDILKGRVGKRVENPKDGRLYDMDLREAQLGVLRKWLEERQEEFVQDVVDELVEMGYERSD